MPDYLTVRSHGVVTYCDGLIAREMKMLGGGDRNAPPAPPEEQEPPVSDEVPF